MKSTLNIFNHIVKEKYNFISKTRFYRQILSKKFNTRNHLVSLISYTLLDALFHPQLQDVFDLSGIEHDNFSISSLCETHKAVPS